MTIHQHIKSLALLLLLSVSSMVKAELTIEITQGVDNPAKIAIVPFSWSGSGPLPENVAGIVAADLLRSGQFEPIPEEDMLSFPQDESEVLFRDWARLGTEFLLIGSIKPSLSAMGTSGYRLDFQLFDVLGQRRMLNKNVVVTSKGLRDMAHFASDEVYQAVTGIRGAFSTKMIYVEANRNSQGKLIYRLNRADVDGARPSLLLESDDPLLSPAWSPDGQQVAYVSFETGRPAIFRQELATSKREQLTNFKGLNGAPAWSPDGKRLAITLSKDGNPEIYILEIASRRLTRVTNHFAIDTEPSWTADGKGIIFTSNRGGKPQIYQKTLASGRVERLTFLGDYNARARLSPDGKTLVVVNRQNGVFHIAAQDLETGDLRILTETRLDESPTIAPNGAMLMYATRHRGKGILAAVSLDAGVKFRLPSQRGDVREPAWSPYFN
ncbi:Tol-Pal system beta propeller repeat protein TolB [Pseudoteredinibacter isoporae]|nr:Tol-Pal system beta propeller repeat protein TolB [Pseudoteredinibacter isoporae]NHO88418.1 Tol-Pal system protein TolB [Pseudoteredinibacter isoporae]NIB23251.1 Tol-Pal system protein TolB [Pseudoteredinibacter isoporae]